MAWFKVDDKLHGHKKAARAGVAAMGMWTVAGSWCADHLTDGFVPDYIAERFAPGQVEELAASLVSAGLWTPDEYDGDAGWRFNDWCDYQPTREDVEAQRERDREKKRRQRRDSGGKYTPSLGSSPRESPGDTEGTPEGVTPSRPDPTRTEKKKPLAPAKPTRERDLIFEAITEACGLDIDELTSSARGAANKAAKELREVGASPDGIHARAKVYRQKWADRELTPSALARHYAQLGAKAKGPPKAGSPVFGSDDWEARQAEQAELERRLLGDSA